MPSRLVQFRAVPPLDAEFEVRRDEGGRINTDGAVAQRDVQRLYWLLAAELRTVRLTAGQAGLLVAVLNGTSMNDSMWAQQPSQCLAYELEDSEPDGVAEQFGVDLDDLVKTVRSWSRGQALAVVDAVERYWTHSDDGDHEQMLAAVGLIRAPREGSTR